MGTKDPNKVMPTISFLYALTLGEMKRQKVQVRAHCGKCHALFKVSLDLQIRTMGEFAILWGRTGECRALGCDGKVEFQARAFQGQSWKSMAKKPSGDYLRIAGERWYDGASDVEF